MPVREKLQTGEDYLAAAGKVIEHAFVHAFTHCYYNGDAHHYDITAFVNFVDKVAQTKTIERDVMARIVQAAPAAGQGRAAGRLSMTWHLD